jgi:hypothetical protein
MKRNIAIDPRLLINDETFTFVNVPSMYDGFTDVMYKGHRIAIINGGSSPLHWTVSGSNITVEVIDKLENLVKKLIIQTASITEYSFVRDGKIVNITVMDTDLPNNDNRSVANIFYDEFGVNFLPFHVDKLLEEFYTEFDKDNIQICKELFEQMKSLNFSENTIHQVESSLIAWEMINLN